jgi:hypothetical protein
MVIMASAARTSGPAKPARLVGPKTKASTRIMAKTPAFTTATACSRALTGVGATMAAGSQAWRGMTADFTATPVTNRANRTASVVPDAWSMNPPGAKSRVPVTCHAQTIPVRSASPPPREKRR